MFYLIQTGIDKSIGFKAFKEGVSLVSEVQSLIPADILDSVVYIAPFREGERKYFSGTAKFELNSEADVERFINHAWEGDCKTPPFKCPDYNINSKTYTVCIATFN